MRGVPADVVPGTDRLIPRIVPAGASADTAWPTSVIRPVGRHDARLGLKSAHCPVRWITVGIGGAARHSDNGETGDTGEAAAPASRFVDRLRRHGHIRVTRSRSSGC
ncbi:hypothetical protein V5P93_004429 [Actinokineospora auranticolor]|uniref:Uncharacterized protein n=1 Tax=Actinokineospora auranticolor TaxID=155976 RepID=A0A2S6GTB1_9PSEU|nr:hypothetical protein [Actinokineospora auranticolor]PPK68464.1 hypothetical protein CLV40_105187 [Actinokineospora auranticolor]